MTYEDLIVPIRIFLWLTAGFFLLGVLTAFLRDDLRYISRVLYNVAALLGIIVALTTAYLPQV